VLQNHAWLRVLCSVSKVFNTCRHGRSAGRSLSLHTAGLTRRSSGRPTAGHFELSSARPCRCCPPLTSYVRPPRTLMSHRHASATSPIAEVVVPTFVSGCASAGGQRSNRFSHRAPLRSWAGTSKSRMAQRSVQRLKGVQRSLPWSLAGAFTLALHRRPNPAIELTASSGLRPPPASAHVKR